MRARMMACLSLVALLSAPVFAGEPDAKQVLDKVAAQYAAMQTYQAEGTIVADMEQDGKKTQMETTFSMKLKKPNLYLIAWTQKSIEMPGMEQSGAVWNAGSQPYLYMGIMKAYSKIGSDEMALGAATGISGGAAHTVPSLFFAVLIPNLGTPIRLQDPKIEKTETLDGEECYVVSGSSVVSKKETFWVSIKGNLIKQYERSFEMTEGLAGMPEVTDEQLDETVKMMGDEPTPEAREKIRNMMKQARETMKTMKMKGVFTERYAKVASPEFAADDFVFKVPEGTTLKESLFGGMTFPDAQDVEVILPAKMSEGIAGAGAIRTVLRVYAAGHGGVYPTLADVKGDALEPVIGIAAADLDGKYFKAASYEVNSTATAYTIKATLGAETYIINEKGVESGTYKTGW